MKTELVTLDPTRKTTEVEDFEKKIHSRIIGQKEAASRMVQTYQLIQAKITPKTRPLQNLLFIGPTGTGKTRTVEVAADLWFGDPNYFTKVDCGEFQHTHEISKLIGSPPGYLGHRETPPVFTQENIEQYQNHDHNFHIILFDEVEKANETLWRLLLGVLDKAKATLGDNRTTTFRRSIIVMTSNLQSMEEVRKAFSPEFINRLDGIVEFKALTPEELLEILELEIKALHDLFHENDHHFQLQLTDKAKKFLLVKGTDARYGARHLKRAVEKHLMLPVANLIATKQINERTPVVNVDLNEGALQFTTERKISAARTDDSSAKSNSPSATGDGRREYRRSKDASR